MVALAEVAASCAVAAATLVAIYPNLFGSPLRALPRTSESSSSFLAGEKSDRFYVPRHLLEDLPTLLTEFAYARPWTSNTERLAALADWTHHYNTERAHSALGGQPPISRLTRSTT